jgi:hypothetical protein
VNDGLLADRIGELLIGRVERLARAFADASTDAALIGQPKLSLTNRATCSRDMCALNPTTVAHNRGPNAPPGVPAARSASVTFPQPPQRTRSR